MKNYAFFASNNVQIAVAISTPANRISVIFEKPKRINKEQQKVLYTAWEWSKNEAFMPVYGELHCQTSRI
ncbi:hypothetical protein [Emticicia sp.]|uniref:hypothetical protein n=1 Tax=Emticicia sp. TaxID=1930953 RepID=UPI003750718F